jgi:hypothetical protein
MYPDKLTNVWGYADAAFARIGYNCFECLCSSVFPAGLVSCATSVLVGAILCRGPHTVTAVLRVMGLGGERRFEKYHRVLSRAC